VQVSKEDRPNGVKEEWGSGRVGEGEKGGNLGTKRLRDTLSLKLCENSVKLAWTASHSSCSHFCPGME